MPESEVHRVCRYGRCDKTGLLTVSWATAFRVRQFARGSLWVLPLAGGLLGVSCHSGQTRSLRPLPKIRTWLGVCGR
jgi:hypothetical protein